MPCEDCAVVECSSHPSRTTVPSRMTVEEVPQTPSIEFDTYMSDYSAGRLEPISNGDAIVGRSSLFDYAFSDMRNRLWYDIAASRRTYEMFALLVIRDSQSQTHREILHNCVEHGVEPHPVSDHCGNCRRKSDSTCAFWRLETTARLSGDNTWSCWVDYDHTGTSDAVADSHMERYGTSYEGLAIVRARRAGCSDCSQYGICSTRNSSYGQFSSRDISEALQRCGGRWPCYLTPPIDYIGEPNYRLEHPLAQDNPDNIPLLECCICHHHAPEGSERGEIEVVTDADGNDYNLCVDTHERYNCQDCSSPLVDGMSTVYWYNDEPVCRNCRDDSYICCAQCGELVREGDSYRDGYNNYCEYCWDEREGDYECGGVAGYHSQDKAREVFGRKADYASRYRIGFELEVENPRGYSERDSTVAIRSMFPEKFVYFEHDGSLSSGYEIITAPFTFGWRDENEQSFKDMLKFLRTNGFRSHMTSTCGLHVHIGREAFYADSDNFDPYRLRTPADQDRWEANVAKMLYIVEKYWTTFLKLSRRNESQINSWAARYGETDHEKLKEYPKRGYSLGRYRAVNLTPSQTIEMRLFRGTLKADTLLATLDLVRALVDCACEEDVTRIKNSRKLSALLGKRMTPRLRAYFETRNCL